jgi:uncharacterized protein YdeI (YjbR/CyaY-like superfamily)
MRVLFFEAPVRLRSWFARRHSRAKELWLGFRKRATGKPSVTWPEAVDEALCVGWIDGVRRSLDGASYVIRFTPRRPGSRWSLVNVRRVRALERAGRMRAAGRAAFAKRDAKKTGAYAHEREHASFSPVQLAAVRADAAAWRFFSAQPPWYRRTATYWVVSARREETRARRMAALIRASAAGRRIAPLARSEARR